MKVRLTTDPNSGKMKSSSRGQKIGTSPSSTEKSGFQNILDEVLPSTETSPDALNELWSRLPDLEKKLLENPTENNLQAYREAVQGIVRSSLKRSTEVVQLKRRSSRGQEVELRVVKVIDEKLHRMLSIVGSPRNAAFQMMKSVEEIRGLLIDLQDRQLTS